jgi:hypothetical protein
MAILLTCPNGHKLSVAEKHAGKKAQCSVCKAIVPIPKPKAPRPVEEAIMPMEIEEVREPRPMMVTEIEEVAMEPVLEDEDYVEMVETEDEDRPRRKKKSKDKALKRAKKRARAQIQGVRTVNLGLAFHYGWHLGFLGIFVISIVALICFYLVFLTRSFGPLGILNALGWIGFVDAAIIMPILGVVGSILCIRVPAEAKGRPLIIVSLALDVALFPMVPVLVFANLGMVGFFVMAGLTLALLLASWILFMLFMKTVAEYLDEWSISRDAVNSIFKGAVLLVGSIIVDIILALLFFKVFLPLAKYMVTYIIFLFFGGLAILGMIAWRWLIVKFVMSVLETIASLRQIIYSRF